MKSVKAVSFILFVLHFVSAVHALDVKDVSKVSVDGEETIIYRPINADAYRFLPLLKTTIRAENNPGLGLDDNWQVFVAELRFGNFATSKFKQQYPSYRDFIFNVGDLMANKNCSFSLRVDGDDINKKKIISVKRSHFDEKGRKFVANGEVCSYYFALNKNILGDTLDEFLHEIRDKASTNNLIVSPFDILQFDMQKNIKVKINIGTTYGDLLKEQQNFSQSELPFAYFTFAYFAINNNMDAVLATEDVAEKSRLFKYVFDYLYRANGSGFQLIDTSQLIDPLDYERSYREKIELSL